MVKYYKVVSENRKARFDYNIIETYKVGLILAGSEVKSIRQGKVNLRDSFGRVEKGAIWLFGIHITPYQAVEKNKLDPLRPRKVLLEKRELVKLIGKVSEKGLTLIPLKIFFEGNWAKVELGLARSKKKYEKREKLRERAIKREIETVFKGKNYGRKNRQ